MPVNLYRDKYPEAFRALRLASRREIAPDFWRVRLTVDDDGAVAAMPAGASAVASASSVSAAPPAPAPAAADSAVHAGRRALDGYRAPGAGDHGRVYVGRAGDGWDVPVDQFGVPTGEFRIETVVGYSADEGWIDLDLLVHRNAEGAAVGLIGPWAEAAPIGSPVVVADPKGSVLMRGAPEAWVLAGDDSAVPAVRRYLAALGPAGAAGPASTGGEVRPDPGARSGLVLLETRYAVDELELDVPEGVEVRILEPSATPTAALAAALEALPRPLPAPVAPDSTADVLLFACAEQSLVAAARRTLARWNIDPDNAVAKGYWKRTP
ncbi:NADPH-dependent ferric siderophore reductase [Microcella putealis]|uniref:NADPH-dependent ferric siderophore reductase n=1 Tax=Microcella putealis TaxID=337005 RepID=A0A4Q7LZ13_9MICO|nr:SIP domain-containing protein [Microcella putealis]RZS59677.1 NADPH-dependent ferric siderophore reductase [Microcella putealis]TQM26790.1 NADPH-dependent ferric siderophore reductase [Microcella putealis]